MDTLKILGLKFTAVFITVLALFGLYANATVGKMLWISFLTTLVTYVIGDLFLLGRFGNVVATAADFILTFLLFVILGYQYIGANFPFVTVSILAAFFVACMEPLVHSKVVQFFSQDVRKDWRDKNQIRQSNV